MAKHRSRRQGAAHNNRTGQKRGQGHNNAANRKNAPQQKSDTPPPQDTDFDVIIVGAGPAGLAAAIRLMQNAARNDKKLKVAILEKAAHTGGHILSGAVFDPAPLDELLPDWQENGAPLDQPVTRTAFTYLTEAGDLPLPTFMMPPVMKSSGHYIISLGKLCRWLADQAEALGVELLTGQAAVDLVYNDKGAVNGIITGAKGVAADGSHKPGYAAGSELKARYVLIAEGSRGLLGEKLIEKFDLAAGSDVQKYGIGLKEVWQIPAAHHRPGKVQHYLGWPLSGDTAGGSFLYHYGDNLVALGTIIHLNYRNPTLSPFDELQRFKTHESVRSVIEGGKRLAYGARTVTLGGLSSVPRTTFPGGALLGCTAGFMNLAATRGSHNAMRSGMLAADAAFDAITNDRSHDLLSAYETGWRYGAIGRELHTARNLKPLWTKFGTRLGAIMLGGADMWLNTLLPFLSYRLKQGKPDRLSLARLADVEPINYPAPDNHITFDKASSVALTHIKYDPDQPAHLHLENPDVPIRVNLPEFGEPAQFYCPAGVYEVAEDEEKGKAFRIHPENCIHCKTCEIKDPWGNISWHAPEGGSGPNYKDM